VDTVAHVHLTGDNEITAAEAEASTQHFTPGFNADEVETPEEVDRTPIDDEQRERLDKRSQPTFQSPFPNDVEVRDRAAEFSIPGEWVHPRLKAQKRQEAMLPSRKALQDLEARLADVAKHDGAPKVLAQAIQKGRDAIAECNRAYDEGAHSENRRFAASPAAKDRVLVALGKATQAVSAMETVAQDPQVQYDWYDGLVAGLDKRRADALKALRAAEKQYASLRATIDAAQALAIGPLAMWDAEWHSSVVSPVELAAPIKAMRDAISYLDEDSEKSDDVTTGAYLVKDADCEGYEGVPAHTLARLKRTADLSQSGSFAQQVYFRALKPHKNDTDAQDAIERKFLRYLTSSSPLTTDLIGQKRDEV
jgi:hypothetical protein